MAYKYDNIRLDKEMYNSETNSFSQVLESLDPSENYFGTPLEGLDAFQRQLKRFDIKVRGANSDTVEKFFRTSESAVLFPEYVARVVRQGMEEASVIPHITASVTEIFGTETMDNPVKLHKRGRLLVSPYEAVRFQKLDLFSVTLRQIGSYIARAQLEDAINEILHDGDKESCHEVTVVSDLDYSALVNFWNTFDPYQMNTLLVGNDTAVKLINLGGSSCMATPFGVNIFGAHLVRTLTMPDSTIIGLDKNRALEMVRSSGVMVECDKLIDRQFERSAITSIAGFAKIFPDASKVLVIK